MIEDFILPATPGAARRLRYLAGLSRLDLDDATLALADEGLLDDQELAALPAPLDGDQRAALQNLLDQNLRGIVCTTSRKRAREVVMSGATLVSARPLIVVSTEIAVWRDLAKLYGHTLTTDIHDEDADLLMLTPFELTQHAVLSKRRGGMLIFDCVDPRQHVAHEYAGPAREVAKTVLITDVLISVQRANDTWSRSCDTRVSEALAVLYPTRAVEVLKGIVDQSANIIAPLRARGFTKLRPADFYPLFNVIIDLMGSSRPR